MLRSIQRYAQVALLIAGSAILLYSCDKESVAEEPNDEALMTEYSEHLTMTNTENGRKSYVLRLLWWKVTLWQKSLIRNFARAWIS